MSKYTVMNAEALHNELDIVKEQYNELCARGLKLDMSRGKPSPEQLELANALATAVNADTGFNSNNGTDCRNYGGLEGLQEIRNVFADILEMDPALVIAGGSSSLNMMFDTIAQGMYKGFSGEKPWLLQGKIKFLCPSPGYDRHFTVCEYFGIEMVPVHMDENGPLISEVTELIKDPAVKGMWCVPKFSNPGGVVYSDEVVTALAHLKPAAKDFRIFWDNAYAVHLLGEEDCKLKNIYNECLIAGNPDLVIQFTSTSKITFAGGGVAAMAASEGNLAEIKSRMSYQTIGPDKVNHLRHAKMFPDIASIREQMQKHAAILAPKFFTVIEGLKTELEGSGIAHWNEPKGGYFISLYVMRGCAKRVVSLCKEAGLVLTPAGAAFPYGKDPDDSNIRIAPSYPSVEELQVATRLLCTSIKYAALEKLCEEK